MLLIVLHPQIGNTLSRNFNYINQTLLNILIYETFHRKMIYLYTYHPVMKYKQRRMVANSGIMDVRSVLTQRE